MKIWNHNFKQTEEKKLETEKTRLGISPEEQIRNLGNKN